MTHFVLGMQVKLPRGWLFVTLHLGESLLEAGGRAR